MRRFGNGICITKVQTLPIGISLQDLYKSLSTEIPSEQASVGGKDMMMDVFVPSVQI
jgi:hypothetical protein